MPKSAASLPYRPCVGIMLLNGAGLVWLGRRHDAPNDEGRGTWWQMPQGGIDGNEDPRSAALRELFEETSVRSAEIIAEAPVWFHYDLPPHLLGRAWGGRFRGQRQKWFAVRFTGDDSEIDVTAPPGHDAEFNAWKWVAMDEVAALTVPFKRDVYGQVVAAFAHLAGVRS